MTHKSLLSLVSLTAVLVLAAQGCGGSSGTNKDAAAGSGGATGSGGSANGDGPSRGEISGDDGAAGGSTDDGGGSGGGAGGSGGGTTDASGERPATADVGGATDVARDTGGPVPTQCQAGEACTGAYMCNATRCLRGEREVCHCVSGSLFCGPADCDAPDAGAADARPDGPPAAMCGAGTTTGDDCNAATDRMCNTACVAGRQRLCFCNATVDEWICTALTRCQN